MATYVVRVWLPDRPGALGAVASRIGAVRGDLIGIDILERGGGRAIDELVVSLPDETLIPLLVDEIAQVDGVDVEDVRPLVGSVRDVRLDALETAAVLVSHDAVDGLLDDLASHAAHDFAADWAAVVGTAGSAPLATVGSPPPAAWMGAFVTGSTSSMRVATGESGPDDVAYAPMASADLFVVLGRRGRPFRTRERRQLAALARIADSRWRELSGRSTELV